MDTESSLTNCPGPKKRPALRESDLNGFKYFGLLDELLARLHANGDCFNRRLHYDEYVALILLYFLDPVLTSLRGISQASALEKVQQRLGVKRASLGSLSESARVFAPAPLDAIVEDLAGLAQAADAPTRPDGLDGLDEALQIIARDGSLLRALPRMAWALWLDSEHRAAKMHLEFNVLKGAPQMARISPPTRGNPPRFAPICAPGNSTCSTPDTASTAASRTRQARSSFVARLHDNAVYETVEDRPLTEADRAAGVVFNRVDWLGSPKKREDLGQPVRLVQVHVQSTSVNGLARRHSRVSSKKTFRHVPEEYDLLLVTGQMDLPAETVTLLYRWRWMIELFFRWLKCIVRFGHLLSESRGGIQVQMYCALIATLLIMLWTGRKPTKRTWEMVQFYLQGWITAGDTILVFSPMFRPLPLPCATATSRAQTRLWTICPQDPYDVLRPRLSDGFAPRAFRMAGSVQFRQRAAPSPDVEGYIGGSVVLPYGAVFPPLTVFLLKRNVSTQECVSDNVDVRQSAKRG